MEKKTNRSSFTGKIGFVLAAAGSAVGLGNIWRFPYLAAQYGGGIFLLIYVILALTFGFTLMTAEIAIGRKTGLSTVSAYAALDRRFAFIGWLGALIPMIILPYYSVIGGWIAKYFASFITQSVDTIAADTYFSDFISSPFPPVVWFLLFVSLTGAVVWFGVEKGVEKVNKVMMPVLVVLTLIVAIYSACMPGALDGVLYYITPNFSKFSVKTVLAAMGQMFYSMSLFMGIMITYGSYMKKDVSIESSVHKIEWFDTGIAFLAGLMIVPAVYVFSGGDEAAMGQGPGLMFVTLPKVFQTMAGGKIVGAMFFLMVLFAALTSSISLYETVVSIFQDKFRWKRGASCAAVFGICLLLGLPSSLGNGAWSGVRLFGKSILDFFDYLSNSIMMPVVALMTCLFVGYVIRPKALIDEIEITGRFRNRRLFYVFIRYIAPVFLVLILASSILSDMGIIKI